MFQIRIIKKLIKAPQYFANELIYLWNYSFKQENPTLKKMDYDAYWIKRGAHIIEPRFKIFAEIIEEGATVLDIGCGDGTLLKYLTEKKNIKGVGIDISNNAIEMARSKGIGAQVCDVSSPDFSVEDDYDYIVLSEVLEHLPNPEEVLDKVRHKFNKSLIVTIPNIGYYRHRIRLLFGRFPIQWVQHPTEHLRFWTVKDFIFWAENLGFQIINIRSSNGLAIFHEHMPNLFGHQIVFEMKEH